MVAERREVAVVALEVGEGLVQEAVGARIDDALDRLCDHGGLHLRRRVRRTMKRDAAARPALQVVPLEARDEVALPEDDVRDETVRLLRREEAA